MAWREGFHVGIPNHRGTARLHSPSNTLILERDNKLITVLNAAHSEYRADHLVECECCGLEYQPSSNDRSCPWCENVNETTESSQAP